MQIQKREPPYKTKYARKNRIRGKTPKATSPKAKYTYNNYIWKSHLNQFIIFTKIKPKSAVFLCIMTISTTIYMHFNKILQIQKQNT